MALVLLPLFVGSGGSGAALTLNGGPVELDGKIDVGGDAAGGSVTVTASDLMVRGKIRATSKLGPGGAVTLSSSGGFMHLLQTVDVRGASGGSISVQAFSVDVVKGLDARGLAGPGGSVTTSGLVHAFKSISLSGRGGDGGTLNVDGYLKSFKKVDVSGTANGGSITVQGGSISFSGKCLARGKAGNGGTLTVSETDPDPDAGIGFSRAKLDFRGALAGGLVHLDTTWIDFQHSFPSQIMVGGGTSPGEIRMNYSGTHPLVIEATLDARESGVVEVLAPNADLTAVGKFLAGPPAASAYRREASWIRAR